VGIILQQDPAVRPGAGHHSVLQAPRLRQVVHHVPPPAAGPSGTRTTASSASTSCASNEKGLIVPVGDNQGRRARDPLP